MPETITVVASATARGGPSLSATQSLEVDAFDFVQVKVPADGSTSKTVKVQPAAADKVQVLMIRCPKREHYASGVTWALASNTTAANRIPLDNVVFLVGAGAIKLLDDAPKDITFFPPTPTVTPGPTPATIDVEIFVGRTT